MSTRAGGIQRLNFKLWLPLAIVGCLMCTTSRAGGFRDELKKAWKESLQQSSGMQANQAAQGAAAGSTGVQWQVQPRSSGIQDVNGVAPAGLDLADPQVAAAVYLEGCRAGGGGGGYFGDINVSQDGRHIAKGNLRGCDAGRIGSNFSFNQSATNRAAEQERAAHIKARNTDQGIGNIGSVQSELSKELNAQVAQLNAHPSCRDGCKDFAVWCSKPAKVGEADRANGISDARYVGLKWLRFGGAALPGGLVISDDKKWHLEKILVRFQRVNGTWTKDQNGWGYDQDAICNRGR